MSEVKITPIEIGNGVGFKGAVSISDEELKNRVDFLEQHTKEFSELVIKAENELYIRELLQRNENLKQELDHSKNNWEELKKWLEEQHQFIIEIPAFTKEIIQEHKTMELCYEDILNKMKELEEKNGEN